MTKQEQPEDPPPEPAKGDLAHAPNGVPHQADEATPTGLPNSDRHETETSAKP